MPWRPIREHGCQGIGISPKTALNKDETLESEDPSHGGLPVPRYGMAMLFVMAALIVTHFLARVVHGDFVFIIFVMASFLAAWYGGLGPGIVALVIGLVTADYFFVEPVYQLGPSTPAALALMLIHLCAAGVGLAAIFYLHRARLRERQIRVIAARLEHEVAERNKALEELRLAKRQIDDHAAELENRVAERTG